MLNFAGIALVNNQTKVSIGDDGDIYFWPLGAGTITNSVIAANGANNMTQQGGQTTGKDIHANGGVGGAVGARGIVRRGRQRVTLRTSPQPPTMVS